MNIIDPLFWYFFLNPPCSRFLHQCTIGAADRLNPLHPFFYGRFGEIGTFFYFLQDTGAFIFFLEAPDSTINILVILNNNADQAIHLPP
jgi:hypothetical protein